MQRCYDISEYDVWKILCLNNRFFFELNLVPTSQWKYFPSIHRMEGRKNMLFEVVGLPGLRQQIRNLPDVTISEGAMQKCCTCLLETTTFRECQDNVLVSVLSMAKVGIRLCGVPPRFPAQCKFGGPK